MIAVGGLELLADTFVTLRVKIFVNGNATPIPMSSKPALVP